MQRSTVKPCISFSYCQASLFLLCLIKAASFDGEPEWEDFGKIFSILAFAYQCLTAVSCWGKSLPAAAKEYIQDAANVASSAEMISFKASLQFWDFKGDSAAEKGSPTSDYFEEGLPRNGETATTKVKGCAHQADLRRVQSIHSHLALRPIGDEPSLLSLLKHSVAAA